jgi:hypothetical protein
MQECLVLAVGVDRRKFYLSKMQPGNDAFGYG